MNLRRLQATAISLLFSLGAFADGSGENGTATISASATKATVGDGVKIEVTVSGITNKTVTGNDGACNYSITIPSGLTTVVESPNGTSQNLSGAGGNGTYDHGTYTSDAVGTYSFGLKVAKDKGTAANTSASVTFCPVAPVALAATDITSKGFTANWESVDGATYKVYVYKDDAEVNNYDADGTSLVISDLVSSTDYTYKVYSIVSGIQSVVASSEIEVTTLTPAISLTAGDDVYAVIGASNQGTFNLDATNLFDSDVKLAVSGENADMFTLDLASVSNFPSNVAYTFAPTAIGKIEAILTATSTYAENKTLTLVGYAKPVAPVASAATNVESSGFTANWASVDGATNYIINVYDVNGNVVDGYENIEVGNVTSYIVDNVSPEQSYSYDVIATGNGAASDKSNKISVTTPKGAVITYVAIGEFETPAGATAEKTIYVDGVNLTGDVTVSLDGDAAFSTNVSSIATTDGAASGAVAITFAPAAVGTYSATVSLATAGAKTKTVAISGKALPGAVTATAATAISENGFTANWEGEKGATYVVTLTAADGTQTATETTGTSYAFTGLASGEAYTYTVQVKENGVESYKSNEISVVTLSAPVVSAMAGAENVQLTWDAVPSAVSYRVSLLSDVDEETKNVTSGYVNFTGLSANTSYRYEVVAIFDNSELSSGVGYVSTTSLIYGQQIDNSGFEEWDNEGTDNVEPKEWNSFMTGTGSLIDNAKNKKLDSSADVRPGSTGTKSAKIWSNEIFGVIANGNLTTGQVVAGSMTPTDQANHNVTVTNKSEFHQVLTSRPDSITVWVKYKPSKASSTASVSAIIHDDIAFEDPWKASAESHIVANANKAYFTEGGEWQRISAEFKYEPYKSNGVDPKFILVTFNSNSSPGGGASGDVVNIDDILLVYKPTLKVEALTKNQYVAGEEISVPYTIEGTMSPYNLNKAANVVSLELSDAIGNFDNATVLTSITTDYSGVLNATLPADLAEGNMYKLRVVTTNYPMTSKATAAFSVRKNPADVVATEATDVTAVSFKANWEAAANAKSYVLTVKKANGDVLKTVETAETTATVAGLSSETSYSYTVKAVNDYLTSQNNSNVVTVKTAGGGSISYDGKTSFTGVVGGQAQNATITVKGAGLIDVIHVLKSGSADFSIGDVTELDADGGQLNVTYTPSTVGVQTASIKLSSKLVNPAVTITLTGTVLPQTVSTAEATDITMSSFTANWNASEANGAQYEVTLYNADNAKILSEVISSTSKSFSNLDAATTYFYDVAVIVEGIKSVTSEKVSVTTNSFPVISEVADVTFDQIILDGVNYDAKTITVNGTNLLGDISAVISGENADQFSIDKEQYAGGENMTIKYNPTSVGVHKATVTLSSTFAQDVVFNVTAIATLSKPEFIGYNIDSDKGYTVTWKPVLGAKSYKVTFMYDNEGVQTNIKIYTTTETSYSISNTKVRDHINYYKVLAIGETNEYTAESDIMTLSMVKPEAIVANEATEISENGFTASWTASAESGVQYVITVTKADGTAVTEQTLTETSYIVTGLEKATDYTYTVVVKNSDGLSSAASVAISVKTAGEVEDDPDAPATSVEDAAKAVLSVYPNPADDVVNISGVDVKQARIFSNDGKLVITADDAVVNVSNLQSGVYFMTVEDNNGVVYTKTVIKK